MKNLKGGYQLIDLQGNDLSSGFTLEGLHQVITLSNNKPLLVTGIVISGTKKNDVYTTAEKSGDDYTFTIYGKTLTISDADAVTVAEQKDFFELDLSEFTFTTSSATLDQTKLETAFNGYVNGQTIKITKLPTLTGLSDVKYQTQIANGFIGTDKQDSNYKYNGVLIVYISYRYQGTLKFANVELHFESLFPPLANKGLYKVNNL